MGRNSGFRGEGLAVVGASGLSRGEIRAFVGRILGFREGCGLSCGGSWAFVGRIRPFVKRIWAFVGI